MKNANSFTSPYLLNKDGLQPFEGIVNAVQNAPCPSNLHRLRSFLGLVNHYSKFLTNCASVLAPLYDLLQKDAKWRWDKEENQAFVTAKYLSSKKILVHFDPILVAKYYIHVLGCDQQ